MRSLRQQKELTREAFCDDEVLLTVRQLARIEAGQSLPTLPKLTYISQKHSVPIHHLIDEKHMELPKKYLELKYKICKIPTYGDADKIKRKEEYFDDIYETYYPNLPEEEQLAIDVLQTSLDVHMSQNVTFGQGIIDDYLFQIKHKTDYSINDLLIIELYLGCIYYEGYDQNLFKTILYNVIEQANFMIETDLFYLRKVLFGSTSIMLVQKEYDELAKVIQVLKLLMKNTQDFQQKPILTMLEGKYQLFAQKNSELAKASYDNAVTCAHIFENELLAQRIEAEWRTDYQHFIEE